LTKDTLNLKDFDVEEKFDPIVIPKETNLVPAETLLEKLKRIKNAN
jgi:hypothetical protein